MEFEMLQEVLYIYRQNDFDILTVEYEGKNYDPDFLAYRPAFTLTITTRKWEYITNEYYQGCDSEPDLDKAIRELIDFLLESEDIFPEHVQKWAYSNRAKLEELRFEYEEND